MQPEVGQVVNGRYRLMRRIGDGGMGSVFMAEHEVLGTTNALKFLHPHLARNEICAARFLREAQLHARVESGHVVRASDVERTGDGTPFLIMEYVEGTTLLQEYERMRSEGTWLDPAQALGYFLQILEGVEAAHERGVVHRDLNPANILVEAREDGAPWLRVLDFGVAKRDARDKVSPALTRPGMLLGTPEYMSPEQALAPTDADARSDVFALGIMLYEMLAGHQPVQGPMPAIVEGFRNSNYPSLHRVLHLDPDLVAVVHRAMAPDAADRFASVADMRHALLPFVAEETLASLPPTVRRSSVRGASSLRCDPVRQRTLFGEPLLEERRGATSIVVVAVLFAVLALATTAMAFEKPIARALLARTASSAVVKRVVEPRTTEPPPTAAPAAHAPDVPRTLEATGTASGKRLRVRYVDRRDPSGRGHFEVQLLEDDEPATMTSVRAALKHFSSRRHRVHAQPRVSSTTHGFDIPLYRDGNYHLIVTADTADGGPASFRCTLCLGNADTCPARMPARCIPSRAAPHR